MFGVSDYIRQKAQKLAEQMDKDGIDEMEIEGEGLYVTVRREWLGDEMPLASIRYNDKPYIIISKP